MADKYGRNIFRKIKESLDGTSEARESLEKMDAEGHADFDNYENGERSECERVLDGKKHGIEIYYHVDGKSSYYMWHMGNLIGEYEGAVKEGKMHGFGKLSYKNGEKYEGEFFLD